MLIARIVVKCDNHHTVAVALTNSYIVVQIIKIQLKTLSVSEESNDGSFSSYGGINIYLHNIYPGAKPIKTLAMGSQFLKICYSFIRSLCKIVTWYFGQTKLI